MSFDTDNSTYYDNAYIMAKVPQIIEEFKQIEETKLTNAGLLNPRRTG